MCKQDYIIRPMSIQQNNVDNIDMLTGNWIIIHTQIFFINNLNNLLQHHTLTRYHGSNLQLPQASQHHRCDQRAFHTHYRVIPPSVTAPKHIPAQPRSHAPTSFRPLAGNPDIVLAEAFVAVKRARLTACAAVTYSSITICLHRTTTSDA